MAQFIAKQDYFGLADGTSLVCQSSSDGKSAEVAEATGADGSYVAENVYGEKYAPSNEYVQKGDLVKSEGDISIGNLTQFTVGEKKITICLNNVSIGTSAGSAPTFSASGEQVEEYDVITMTDLCKFNVPSFTLSKKHHAQILFNSHTLTGTGCHLKSASYTISGSITKAEKEGVCLAHDIVEGKIECSIEILQTGSTVPTITAGQGWFISAPLACSNPDADWPTYSATLIKHLTKSDN